jgi:hypothetical protein
MYREGEDGNAGNYFAKFRVAKKKIGEIRHHADEIGNSGDA